MDELRQMFTTSYEYAVEQLETIGSKPYAYWEGQRDAYRRAVDIVNGQIVAEEYDEAVRALSEEGL